MTDQLSPSQIHGAVKEHLISLHVPEIQAERIADKAYREIVKLRSAQQALQRSRTS